MRFGQNDLEIAENGCCSYVDDAGRIHSIVPTKERDMKRTLVASLFGMVASLTMAGSSYGQGQVFFDNYGSTPYYPIMYDSDVGWWGSLAGHGVGGTWKVELAYALGNNNAAGLINSGVVVSVNPVLMAPPGGVGAPETGYFQGPIVTVPGYASGPVTFEFLAWDAGPSGTDTYATAVNKGSLVWTEASISGPGNPAGFFQSIPGPTLIHGIPEPSPAALTAMGAMVLVTMRKRVGYFRLRNRLE